MFQKFLWLLLLCGATLLAQEDSCEYRLHGKVIDFHDSQPLALAQIYVYQLQRTFTTNDNGEYAIMGLCNGEYSLRVSHVDCDVKEFTVAINGTKKRDFLLEHHIDQLDQVQVTVDVHDDHENTQSSTRITKSTIEDFSGATLGDALNSVAGVSALKTGNSVVKPVIHGLHSSRVVLVNDGLRQQDQEWGVEHAPNIDLNTASSIEVIKGANALRYGADAIGGTIVISPERIIVKDTLIGRVILNGQSNGRGGSVSSSFSNYNDSGWYQRGTITYKKLGDYEAPDYVLSNTGSELGALNLTTGFKKFEYGFNVNYSFYQTELGILRASHIGNASDLVRSINSGEPTVIRPFTYDINEPKQAVIHHGLRLDGYQRIAGLGKLEMDYSLQFNNRKEFDIRRGANSGRASLDIDLLTQTASAYLNVDRYENTELEVGLDGMYQINQPDASTGVRRLIPDYNSFRIGAFASWMHQPSDHWVLDAGLRYDRFSIDAQKFYIQSRWEALGYDEIFPQFEVSETGNQILTNPQLDYNLFAFTLGAKHIFNNHYDIAINLSSANRAPNPSELFSDGLHHALATIELGQLDLKQERSYKLNTTFHVNKNHLDLEINPYFNHITDFIQLIPTGIETTTRGAFPVWQYQQLDAQLLGIDVSYNFDFFRRKVKELERDDLLVEVRKIASIDGNASYIYGSDLTGNQPLIDMPPAQFTNRFTWYQLGIQNLSAFVANQTVLAQNRFPDNDYIVTVPTDNGQFANELVRISQPPAAYSLWDVGVNYAFAKARLSLSVSNLFNTRYRNYLNRQRFYADEVGTNIQFQFIYNI